MTDNEIVKALECCSKSNTDEHYCEDCPCRTIKYCASHISINALDLINRQKADNKKLLKECYELHKDANRLKEENASQKAEIESYKHLDVILNTAIDKLAKDLKSEAYREFAERMHCQCESIINQPLNEKVAPLSWKVAYEEFEEKIDNLLNELVGEDGGEDK